MEYLLFSFSNKRSHYAFSFSLRRSLKCSTSNPLNTPTIITGMYIHLAYQSSVNIKNTRGRYMFTPISTQNAMYATNLIAKDE